VSSFEEDTEAQESMGGGGWNGVFLVQLKLTPGFNLKEIKKGWMKRGRSAVRKCTYSGSLMTRKGIVVFFGSGKGNGRGRKRGITGMRD